MPIAHGKFGHPGRLDHDRSVSIQVRAITQLSLGIVPKTMERTIGIQIEAMVMARPHAGGVRLDHGRPGRPTGYRAVAQLALDIVADGVDGAVLPNGQRVMVPQVKVTQGNVGANRGPIIRQRHTVTQASHGTTAKPEQLARIHHDQTKKIPYGGGSGP